MSKFKVGDILVGNVGSPYVFTGAGSIVEVVDLLPDMEICLTVKVYYIHCDALTFMEKKQAYDTLLYVQEEYFTLYDDILVEGVEDEPS